jgi:hypothetical protein
MQIGPVGRWLAGLRPAAASRGSSVNAVARDRPLYTTRFLRSKTTVRAGIAGWRAAPGRKHQFPAPRRKPSRHQFRRAFRWDVSTRVEAGLERPARLGQRRFLGSSSCGSCRSSPERANEAVAREAPPLLLGRFWGRYAQIGRGLVAGETTRGPSPPAKKATRAYVVRNAPRGNAAVPRPAAPAPRLLHPCLERERRAPRLGVDGRR